MIRTLLILAISAFGLVGCDGSAPQGAAESASRLLSAAVKGDRVAFEAEIDRAAVRDDVRRQVAVVAKAKVLDVEGGPSEFALDRMIGPNALRLVQAGTGEALTAAPSLAQVTGLMHRLGNKRACLRDAAAHCLLTFAKGRAGWRLVGMQATDLKIEVGGD